MRNRLAAATAILAGVQTWAAPPDWLQAAAREPLSGYPGDTPAVMLLNEQIVTVKNSGEVITLYRGAYKILRPEGRRFGVIQAYYDSETRIGALKGWSIPLRGAPYDAGDKETVDSILFTENLYEDARQKVLQIPAAEPGAVIGYEYEQRGRPSILQDRWLFQREVPVRRARLELSLPPSWEHTEVWANHASVPPLSPSPLTWELRDLPAINEEPAMPAWESVAGQLLLTYIRPGGGNVASWSGVGRWYAQLTAARRQSTPELRQKALELSSEASTPLDKIRALAFFVQSEVRYVAIEIGKGGYQPHFAADILKNRYGDCKDKATLLSAMLNEIGVESVYVLINSRRGVVNSDFASPLVFDHAILAIRPPEPALAANFHSGLLDAQLGPLIFFDPTDPYVPFGELPAILQSSDGLVVAPDRGALVKLPLAPPSSNSLDRTANLRLAADGSIDGDVREIRQGASAADFRAGWLNARESEKRKSVQNRLGWNAANVELKELSAKDLDKTDRAPELTYRFRIGGFAKAAGGLVLFEPALSEWGAELTQSGPRTQPIEFSSTSHRNEVVDITLPDGLLVDELPPPVAVDIGTAAYHSTVEAVGKTIRYTRLLEIRGIAIPSDQFDRLKDFYHQIGVSEKTKVVLKPQ